MTTNAERLNTINNSTVIGGLNFTGPLRRRGQEAKTTYFVLDRDLLTPPVSPVEGDHYLIPSAGTPSGAWTGFALNSLAAYHSGAWVNFALTEGVLLDIADEDKLLRWSGAALLQLWPAKEGSNSPVGVLVPEFKGQNYVDNITGDTYTSSGLTNADWKLTSALSTVTVFDTVAQMKASSLNLNDNRAILLLGYYTPGDGGGGQLVHRLTDGGVFGQLTITNGGSGYAEGVQLVPLIGGNNDAEAYIYIRGGIVVDGWIAKPGSGYTAAASPDMTGLSGANFAGTFALGDDLEAFVQTAYNNTARRFVRRQSSPFTARQAGAHGDTIQNPTTGALTNRLGGAVNDDTAALQRLADKGRLVDLQTGTFNITSAIKYRYGTILRGDRAWTAVNPERWVVGKPSIDPVLTIASDDLPYDIDRDCQLIYGGAATNWDVDAATGTPICMLQLSVPPIGDAGAGWASNLSADTRAMYGCGVINLGLDCNNKADMGIYGWLCGWGSSLINVHAWRAKWAGIFMTDLWSTVIDRCGAFYCEDNGMVFGQPKPTSTTGKFFNALGGVVNAVQFNNPRAAWNGFIGGTPGSLVDGGGNSKQFGDNGINGGTAGFPNYHGCGLIMVLERGNAIINAQGELCDGPGCLIDQNRDPTNGMANIFLGGYMENNGEHARDAGRAVWEYNLVVVCSNGMNGMVIDSMFCHPLGKVWIAGQDASFNAGSGIKLLPQDYLELRNVKSSGINPTGTGAVNTAGLRADHKFYRLVNCDIEVENNIVGATVGSSGTQPDPNGGLAINGNLLCQNTMVLARATINLSSGSTTIDEGHNVNFNSHVATGKYRFTFNTATPARNANYTVVASISGTDGNAQPFSVIPGDATQTVSQFELWVYTGATAGQALNNAGGKKCHVVVYGARDVSGLVKT